MLHLKNPDDLIKGSEELPLEAINNANDSGSKLLAGAKRILVNLGKTDVVSISFADTADTKRIFAQTRFNGDGIVPVDSATDVEVRQVIEEIIVCLGGEMDRSGQPGVNLAKVEAFFTQARALVDRAAEAESDRSIKPLGPATEVAAAAVRAVKTKIDDYFARCRLAAFDPRATGQ